MEPAAFVLPTQFPACQPVPVTMPILSAEESFASAVVALEYASSQLMTARLADDDSDGMAAYDQFTEHWEHT